MKNKRLYLLPVVLFSLIVVFRILSLVFTIYLINKLGSSLQAISLKNGLMSFWVFFWPCLLIAEIVIYYVIRKRLNNRQWVLIHSLCNLFIFVALPLSVPFFVNLFFGQYSGEEFKALMNTVSQVRFWVFYFFLLVGHVFFILTIVKGFKKKQESHEPAGLLDEFVN